MKLGELPVEFFAVVRELRRLPARYQVMCLYAAQHWPDEVLDEKEAAGDLPGQPGAVKPEASSLQ